MATCGQEGIEFASLRDGARTVLAAGLSKLGAEDAGALAAQLERATHAASVRLARANRRSTPRGLYTSTLRAVTGALARQIGPFPEDVVGVMAAAGRLTPEAVVEESLNASDVVDPREVIRRLFVRTLVEAADEYDRDRARALETARALESACFGAVVRASKESEEPPRRQWDSPVFADTYSTRCGTIAALLDPKSSSCVAYGATLVGRILSSELKPEEIGDMSEKALCPQATAGERAEIAKRSEQKVTEKESNLFRCPHCGERRCTYREVQRRSLDEAPDYLCYCLSCNRRFSGRS